MNNTLTAICLVSIIALIISEYRLTKAKKKIKEHKEYKESRLNQYVYCLNLVNEDVTVSYVRLGNQVCRYSSGEHKRSMSDYDLYSEFAYILKDNVKYKKGLKK